MNQSKQLIYSFYINIIFTFSNYYDSQFLNSSTENVFSFIEASFCNYSFEFLLKRLLLDI